MGMLNALNPFSFSKKYYAAWNALMAAYTFDQLSSDQKQQVIQKVEEIESSVLRRPIMFIELVANLSSAQLNHFFSLAMINLGIRPALGKELWFEVKNPCMDLVNAEEILASTKHKLEKQFGVEFPNLSN